MIITMTFLKQCNARFTSDFDMSIEDEAPFKDRTVRIRRTGPRFCNTFAILINSGDQVAIYFSCPMELDVVCDASRMVLINMQNAYLLADIR